MSIFFIHEFNTSTCLWNGVFLIVVTSALLWCLSILCSLVKLLILKMASRNCQECERILEKKAYCYRFLIIMLIGFCSVLMSFQL